MILILLLLSAMTDTYSLIITGLVLGSLWFLNRTFRGLKIKNISDQYVFITGCDTGFGFKAAKKLDYLGFHVFAACLTKEKMQELKDECSKRLTTVQMDVTDDETIALALDVVERALPEGKGLWALLNNAGIVGANGVSEWITKQDYETTLNINTLGLVMVTKAFLPLVRKAKGRIINTASVIGRFAFPPAPYAVSKFCVEGFTDVLRREMNQFGVSVHTVEPGGYQTNITDYNLAVNAMERSFKQSSDDVKSFYGFNYVKRLATLAKLVCYVVACPRLYEVVDTYVHAVTARYPKTRYCVGMNGNLIFKPFWMVPSWIPDLVMGMLWPLPQGMNKS